MNEKERTDQPEELEIDLGRIVRGLMAKAWLIGIVSVLCALITLAGTVCFAEPQYRSFLKFYVNNNTQENGSQGITASDISASRGLVKSCIALLDTRQTLVEVIDHAKTARTTKEVGEMIFAEAVDDTEIFRVVVTSPNPREARMLADAVAQVLPQRIADVMEGTSAKVVEDPVTPGKPNSPGYGRNTLIGFLLGLGVSTMAVGVWIFTDTTIRDEEDILQNSRCGVLASVPQLPRKKRKGAKMHGCIAGRLSPAAAEAYKLLCTKLRFCFSEGQTCPVVGISGTISGEGKTMTAIHLAHTLSELGKRVVLVDCDLRRPAVQTSLKLESKGGLSGILAGHWNLQDVLHTWAPEQGADAIHVIAAGENPPNPLELLSRDNMTQLLGTLKNKYDYVILDLPPVATAGEALVAAGYTDGVLLVIQENTCSIQSLDNMIRQLEFVSARTLGVVYNCAARSGGRSAEPLKL